jgi:hypothetical protein
MTIESATDQLLTITEISIALAGFAGIIATFQFRQLDRLSSGHVVSLAMIVNISLVGAFFSVMPIALFNFGLSEHTTWAVSSALLGINILAFFEYVRRNAVLTMLKKSDQMFFRVLFTLALMLAVSQFMNAAGVVFHQEFGPFFVAFIFCFFLVCYNFSRLLLRPLWRIVRDQASLAEEH